MTPDLIRKLYKTYMSNQQAKIEKFQTFQVLFFDVIIVFLAF